MPLSSQGVSLKVAEVDNSGNDVINDLIGNRDDGNNSQTIYSWLRDTWEKDHHAQKVYPTLASAVTVTAHNNAWQLGSFVEIVPLNTITTEFHIHHINIIGASANGEYEIVLYAGTTELTRASFSRTDKKDDVEGLDIATLHSDANSQIQAKIASENIGEDTVKIKLWYHLHAS